MKNLQLLHEEEEEEEEEEAAEEAARWKRLCLQELHKLRRTSKKNKEKEKERRRKRRRKREAQSRASTAPAAAAAPEVEEEEEEEEEALDLRRRRRSRSPAFSNPGQPRPPAPRLLQGPPPPLAPGIFLPAPPCFPSSAPRLLAPEAAFSRSQAVQAPLSPGSSSSSSRRPPPEAEPSSSSSSSCCSSSSGPPSETKALQQTRRLLANARERSRVHTISAAFEALRKQVPCYSYGQKLSKLAILRIACNYILSLARLADLDYSADHSNMSFSECVEQCTRTLQAEGRSKKRKE